MLEFFRAFVHSAVVRTAATLRSFVQRGTHLDGLIANQRAFRLPDQLINRNELPSLVALKALRSVRKTAWRQTEKAPAESDQSSVNEALLSSLETLGFTRAFFTLLPKAPKLAVLGVLRSEIVRMDLMRRCYKQLMTSLKETTGATAADIQRRVAAAPCIEMEVALADKVGDHNATLLTYKMVRGEGTFTYAIAMMGRQKYVDVPAGAMLPSSFKDSIQQLAVKKDVVRVPVGQRTIEHVLATVADRQRRQKAFDAYAEGWDDDKVASAMLELLRVRHEIANQLGFTCWGDMQIQKRTVETRESLRKLYGDVLSALQPHIQALVKNAGKSAAISDRTTGKQPASGQGNVDYVDFQHHALNAVHWQKGHDPMQELRIGLLAPEILEMLSDIHGFHFEAVPTDLSNYGWPSHYQLIKVYDRQDHQRNAHRAQVIAFLYMTACLPKNPIGLFGQWSAMISGFGNVSTEMLADGHIHVSCPVALNPSAPVPLHSITAVCHELGHAMHFIHYLRNRRTIRQAKPLTPHTHEATDKQLKVGGVGGWRRLGYLFREPSALSRMCAPSVLAKSAGFNALDLLQLLQLSLVDDHLHGPDLEPNKCTPRELVESIRSVLEKTLPNVELPHNMPVTGRLQQYFASFAKHNYAGIFSVYLVAHVRASCAMAAYRRALQKGALSAYSSEVREVLQHPIYPEAAMGLRSTLDPSEGSLEPLMPGVYGKARNTAAEAAGRGDGLFGGWRKHPAEHLLARV
ncbi:unnamed protein product [Vitrella brassicaformis CCMP3155]|uniref:Uncharacterized protein n=1 Tax=Vitrella brassicaformis (strain CCMP3155) TaxID=1169540 RepID=A0A0G4EEL1_VITBC|nr:unnamed protein product [Vitrella brassicaformis CCMP3155]|eukprot:CEL93817.1 unnamed protein product [Vitrella brassicaformis CCMP3155]